MKGSTARTRPVLGKAPALGLSIARWIVEQHDGRIEVLSAPGEGSRFTVWLREYRLG